MKSAGTLARALHSQAPLHLRLAPLNARKRLRGTGWVSVEKLQALSRRKSTRCPFEVQLQQDTALGLVFDEGHSGLTKEGVQAYGQPLAARPVERKEDVEIVEKEMLAQQYYGRSWKELSTREKQSVAARIVHARYTTSGKPLSIRAQQRAVQQQKNDLALAYFGKPFKELEHQQKLMMAKLWSNKSIVLQGVCAASLQPGLAAPMYEEHLFQRRLHYLAEQEQGTIDKRKFQASWEQERDALSRQHYGQAWDDLSPQDKQSVTAYMRHHHQTILPDIMKNYAALKQQQLQEIALERFGQDCNGLPPEDKAFVVRLWRQNNTLKLPEPQWRLLREQKQQTLQDREEIALAVLGKSWASLAKKEQHMIVAHMRYINREFPQGVATAEAGGLQAAQQHQDRLAAIKQRIIQAQQKQHETQKRRDELAIQFYGKPWNKLTQRENKIVSCRMGKLNPLEKERLKQLSAHAPEKSDPMAQIKEEMAQLFFDSKWEQLSEQQKRAIRARLPLATPEYIQQQRAKLQKQVDRDKKKEFMSMQLFGCSWQALNTTQKRSIATRLLWAAARSNEDTTTPVGKLSKSAAPPVHTAPPSGRTPDLAENAAVDSMAGEPAQPPPPQPAGPPRSGAPQKPDLPTKPKKAPMPAAAPAADTPASLVANPSSCSTHSSIHGGSAPPEAAEPEVVPTVRTETGLKRTRARAPAKSKGSGLRGSSSASGSAPPPNPPARGSAGAGRSASSAGAGRSASSAEATRAPEPMPVPAAEAVRQHTSARVPTQPAQAPQAGKEVKSTGRGRKQKLQQKSTKCAIDSAAAAAAPSTASPSPLVPQPSHMSAMLQRLEDMQGVGDKIKQVLTRLESSRELYKRLPPERVAEKERYFHSVENAHKSLAHIAHLEFQLLQSIRQGRSGDER